MRTSMPGCASWKSEMPRQQPFGGQRGQRRDRQHVAVVPAQQPVGRKAEIIEGGADAGKIFLRFRRQRQRAILPDEQPHAQFLLQPLDLVADRGLGDVQLGAAWVKLICRAAASKARKPFSEGSLAVICRHPNT